MAARSVRKYFKDYESFIREAPLFSFAVRERSTRIATFCAYNDAVKNRRLGYAANGEKDIRTSFFKFIELGGLNGLNPLSWLYIVCRYTRVLLIGGLIDKIDNLYHRDLLTSKQIGEIPKSHWLAFGLKTFFVAIFFIPETVGYAFAKLADLMNQILMQIPKLIRFLFNKIQVFYNKIQVRPLLDRMLRAKAKGDKPVIVKQSEKQFMKQSQDIVPIKSPSTTRSASYSSGDSGHGRSSPQSHSHSASFFSEGPPAIHVTMGGEERKEADEKQQAIQTWMFNGKQYVFPSNARIKYAKEKIVDPFMKHKSTGKTELTLDVYDAIDAVSLQISYAAMLYAKTQGITITCKLSDKKHNVSEELKLTEADNDRVEAFKKFMETQYKETSKNEIIRKK